LDQPGRESKTCNWLLALGPAIAIFAVSIHILALKKLYKLVIGTFIGPFIITFAVVLFIFLMQFVWKWVDDFMGKGLEMSIILELLLYASANLVNVCLPLAILLSSIMTFGNLAEHFELVALKSSGVSLHRIMFPLTLFVIMLTFGAFYFANNVAPVATLKFKTLLWDITQAKPSIELRDGVFYNGMEGYSIRVTDNDKATGNLNDMLIYDHSKKDKANKTVIRAERGRMEQTDDKRFLILTLYNGYTYDESDAQGDGKSGFPMVQNRFEKDVLRIDVSNFLLSRSDEDQWKNHMQMLTMGQLLESIDSLSLDLGNRKREYNSYLNRSFHLLNDSNKTDFATIPIMLGYYDSLNYQMKRRAVNIALNIAQNSKNYVSSTKQELFHRKMYINRHYNEWHRKITLPFACLVFFFIGAPLGAIIKKGGIGLPVVISVLFFLVFHVVSMTGEKMAKTGVLDPFTGMWLSTFVLFPISVFLTYRASKDAMVFEPGTFDRLFAKLKFWKKKDL
jgi:lipopolysaccharide export system permease protein